MPPSISSRMIATPSPYTREHCLFVQEIGSLVSVEPHLSSRRDIKSFLFLLVLTGRGSFCYQGVSYPLKQGDCVWADCALPYSHRSSQSSPWEIKWVHFYGKSAEDFYRFYLEQGYPTCFSSVNAGAFNETLSHLWTLHQADDSLKELLSHKYLTDIITLCFAEHANGLTDKKKTTAKVCAVHSYVKEHFAEPLTLDLLAGLFYISKFYLTREYKKLFGTTLGNDLTAIRISHAKSLLRFSDTPIQELAAACGYQDSNYFTKVFRKSEGITPLEYRRKW